MSSPDAGTQRGGLPDVSLSSLAVKWPSSGQPLLRQSLGDPVQDALTIFSWGYEGWGNWTDELVAAVDAVEESCGWGPPMFVDIP